MGLVRGKCVISNEVAGPVESVDAKDRGVPQRLGCARGVEDDGGDAGEPLGPHYRAVLISLLLPADLEGVAGGAHGLKHFDRDGLRADFREGTIR